MKVIKNACYGGFSLSAKAQRRIAEIMDKELFFFKYSSDEDKYERITEEEAGNEMFSICYTVPNPEDYRLDETDHDGLYKSANERARSISLPDFRDTTERNNPILIQVVEELGDAASGRFAKLVVVEIPDGIDYEISEYDGFETVEEKHGSW